MSDMKNGIRYCVLVTLSGYFMTKCVFGQHFLN